MLAFVRAECDILPAQHLTAGRSHHESHPPPHPRAIHVSCCQQRTQKTLPCCSAPPEPAAVLSSYAWPWKRRSCSYVGADFFRNAGCFLSHLRGSTSFRWSGQCQQGEEQSQGSDHTSAVPAVGPEQLHRPQLVPSAMGSAMGEKVHPCAPGQEQPTKAIAAVQCWTTIFELSLTYIRLVKKKLKEKPSTEHL